MCDKPKVWWFSASKDNKSPGTVVINWPDGGQSIRSVEDTEKEGKNVWHVAIDNDFVRDNSEHTLICNELFQKEIERRKVC